METKEERLARRRAEFAKGQTNLEIFENYQDYNARLIELDIILDIILEEVL